MDAISDLLAQLESMLTRPLFSAGSTHFTPGKILVLLLPTVLLFVVTKRIRRTVTGLLSRKGIEQSAAHGLGALVHYTLVLAGLAAIFETVGIDLSAFTVIAGALSIGVGFGLQSITANWVSGLVLLIERPVKIGDRVEVGELAGDVISISARATTVLTNDNVAVIVPNSQFTTSQVVNWSHSERKVRIGVPLRVSHGSDPAKVRRILLEVAVKQAGVLAAPVPEVVFESFGESSLDFTLHVWTTEYVSRPRILRSHLYFAVFEAFRAEQIEIPFPQRDLHIKSGGRMIEALQ